MDRRSVVVGLLRAPHNRLRTKSPRNPPTDDTRRPMICDKFRQSYKDAKPLSIMDRNLFKSGHKFGQRLAIQYAGVFFAHLLEVFFRILEPGRMKALRNRP